MVAVAPEEVEAAPVAVDASADDAAATGASVPVEGSAVTVTATY